MTWYFTTSGTKLDVYDHTGTQVATNREFSGTWTGDYPDKVLAVMRENMNDDQPNAYNQTLLADAATGNIEERPPP